MYKRIITSLVIALLLVATMALPAVAESIGTSLATVHVNSQISVTISDDGTPNIAFGSLNAGANNILDTNAGPTTPSITISVAGTAIVDLTVSGTNFGTGFAVSQAKYLTTYADPPTGATQMSTSPTSIENNVSPGNDVEVWFWLDVPSSGVVAGDYSSTFTFIATE